jgi:hypothetical protein
MKTNLKNYALKVLEVAKEDLRRDKYLLPVAFIVTDEEVFDFNLQFEDAQQKKSVYAELIEVAKEKAARAIITINDATITNDLEGTSSATTREDRRTTRNCIFLTISGPSVTTWSLSLPYDSDGNKIVFGNPTETSDDVLNLLPGWPGVRKLDT